MNTQKGNKDTTMEEIEQLQEAMRAVEHCNGELRKFKKKLDQLLDSSPDAMVFVNTDSRITMVNTQFSHMFGYTQDEVRGKELEILIPERFRDKHKEQVQSFLSNPVPRPMGMNLEIHGLKKNGDEFPADIGLSVLKTEEEYLSEVKMLLPKHLKKYYRKACLKLGICKLVVQRQQKLQKKRCLVKTNYE